MKCVVTGGGGFLGLYIVEQLRAREDDVRAFCRGRYPRLDELGVETFRGDVRDAEAVRAACRNAEVVFHTAAVPGVWGPWKTYYGINTVGTRNVIAACRAEGVPALVYTSSPSVIFDGRPHENVDESYPYPDEATYLCHYPRSKALAERDVLAANGDGLATVALRPHLIWGLRDNHLIPRLIGKARSGRLRRVGDGTNLIAMTYVENAAAAHVQAADALRAGSCGAGVSPLCGAGVSPLCGAGVSPAEGVSDAETTTGSRDGRTTVAACAGKAYFINEPQPVNLWQWVDELLGRAGLPPVKKAISAKAAWRVGAACEGVYRLLRLPGEPPMTRFVAAQLGSSHYYNIAAAVRDFGFEPPVSVDEGLRRLEPDLRRLAE